MLGCNNSLRPFVILAMVLVVSVSSAQGDPSRKQLNRLLRSDAGYGIDDWHTPYDNREILPDTLTLHSYPYGYRPDDPCHTAIWAFRSRSRLNVSEGFRCQEPPVGVIKGIGTNMKWKIVKRWDRSYMTLFVKRLPIATFEVVRVVEGTPTRAESTPHTVTLVRQEPW